MAEHDLLDVIETKYGTATTPKAKFDYDPANDGSGFDALGRRLKVRKTGDLYSGYGDGTQGLDTTWSYDALSQMTAEQTNLGNTSTPLTGRADAYAWDNMGNRSSTAGTTHNGNTASYTTNERNQYTQRTVNGVFDVAGFATGGTVYINGSSSGVTQGSPYGNYFFKGQSMSNGSAAVFSSLTFAVGTTNFPSFPAFLPLTPEPFTYDDDGNLTRDGRWVYVYDSENRLIAQFTRGAPADDPDHLLTANSNVWTSGVAQQKILFTYDYLGRRVDKLLSNWNSTSSAWNPATEERFVYNGWNVMAKLDALSSNALVASYYWGLDWSGTLQGAGGVGGLALVVDSGNKYLPMFDGNGNVMGLITAASVTLNGNSYSAGGIVAAYEYDAFGQTLRETGDYAAYNPFRFSTKYADIESGLVYYGLRYYSPSLGRFINKDPSEEQGGLNLYAFCLNNTPNAIDVLGLDPRKVIRAGNVTTVIIAYFPKPGQEASAAGAVANTAALWSGPTSDGGQLNVNFTLGTRDDYLAGNAVYYQNLGSGVVGSDGNPLVSVTKTVGGRTYVTIANDQGHSDQHEFGHVMGLDDRYEYVMVKGSEIKFVNGAVERDLYKSAGWTVGNGGNPLPIDKESDSVMWDSSNAPTNKDRTRVVAVVGNSSPAPSEKHEPDGANFDRIIDEANRVTRFNLIADLGSKYIGSDEWIAAHGSVSQWKLSVFKQNQLFNSAMASAAIGTDLQNLYAGAARFNQTQAAMAELMQEAVAAGESIKQSNER